MYIIADIKNFFLRYFIVDYTHTHARTYGTPNPPKLYAAEHHKQKNVPENDHKNVSENDHKNVTENVSENVHVHAEEVRSC